MSAGAATGDALMSHGVLLTTSCCTCPHATQHNNNTMPSNSHKLCPNRTAPVADMHPAAARPRLGTRFVTVSWAEPKRSDAGPEALQQVKSIYVGGIPPDADTEKLSQIFSKYGAVEKVGGAAHLALLPPSTCCPPAPAARMCLHCSGAGSGAGNGAGRRAGNGAGRILDVGIVKASRAPTTS
jgi:hypothetical protein